MANEVTVRSGLRIKSGLVDYQSRPTSFRTNLTTTKGPTPGVITIAVLGTQITFSQLVQPGLVFFYNMDAANFVEFGIKDPGTGKFYPLGEIRAGECFPFRFSRNLLSDYYNTGTGTDGDVNYLWFKANTAAVNMLIECFEGNGSS